MAADWYELMVPQHIMQSSIAGVTGLLHDHTTAPIPANSFLLLFFQFCADPKTFSHIVNELQSLLEMRETALELHKDKQAAGDRVDWH